MQKKPQKQIKQKIHREESEMSDLAVWFWLYGRSLAVICDANADENKKKKKRVKQAVGPSGF